MFYFLIFFVFLEVLHCCLHIWRRSSLLQSLQTGFGRELSHLESDVGFWGFLWPLLWMCLLHTFWSLLKGIRKIICFVSIPQSQASAESLPFVFSRVVPWNTEVCEPFPNSIVMLAFSTCLLAICKGSVSPSIRAHAKIRPMWVSGLGLGKAYRVLRVTVSQLRGSESEQSPVACGKPSWWVSINRFIASLWSSEPWFMCSHSLSQPLSLTDHFSNVGDKGQKWVSWAVSCLAGKARYSHTSVDEIAGCRGLSWHQPWWRGDASKVKMFLLLSSMHLFLRLFFWPQWCAGTSLLDSQAPTKELLSVNDYQNKYPEREWQ